MKEQTCCFSGHRHIPSAQTEALKYRLIETVETLIKQGYTRFEAGGAVGFDTLAATAVLTLKKVYPNIELALILPGKDQTMRWKDEDVRSYENIKKMADEVVFVCEKCSAAAFLKRNRRMVDDSSVLVCYQTKSGGGTAYTIGYAYDSTVRSINIANM